jgi:hypothetical protein
MTFERALSASALAGGIGIAGLFGIWFFGQWIPL